MWNRVLLLAAGLASGWSLVSYLIAGPTYRSVQRWRLLLAAALGAILVIFHTIDGAAVGLGAFLIYAISASLAYIAHARDLTAKRAPIATPLPEEDPPSAATLLLISEGEPCQYSGPQLWQERLRLAQVRGQNLPHELTHPLALARIRQAYAHMPQEHCLDHWRTEIVHRIEECTDLQVRALSLCDSDLELRRTVQALARANLLAGIIPLWLDQTARQSLRGKLDPLLTGSGVKAPYIEIEASDELSTNKRLERLLAGESLQKPTLAIEVIVNRVLASLHDHGDLSNSAERIHATPLEPQEEPL